MRKLVYGINVTIDGCCDHTKGIPDVEVHEYFTHRMREAGVLVYGRKTYELMVPFWPEIAKNPTEETKGIAEFAQAFDSVPQMVVFSKTLEQVANKKTRIVRGNLEEEILKLKKEPGKDISLGGVDLPSQLFKLGLVDEVHIIVQPVVVGKGRRLFDEMDLTDNLKFKLIGTKVFKSGCVALHYVKP